jgi:hypothetical protein
MPSKTWQFLMVWPFLVSSHSDRPELLDFGVRRRSRRELIQGTRVPLCEKGDFLLHRNFLLGIEATTRQNGSSRSRRSAVRP